MTSSKSMVQGKRDRKPCLSGSGSIAGRANHASNVDEPKRLPTPWVGLLLAVTLSLGQFARTAAQEAGGGVDAVAVLTAIDRGVGYLKREQSARGTWDDVADQEGGTTALATLALLSAGVEVDDPTIQKSLAYLREKRLDKTYCVSLQTMVMSIAEPKRDLPKIQQNVEWLEAVQIRGDRKAGAWSYPAGDGDNSNTQFAMLALYEAQRAGAVVQPETWQTSIEYWKGCQNGDGSWGYWPNRGGTGSMTSAGIGSLVMARLATQDGDATVEGDRVKCCQSHEDDDDIERAIAWLARHFSVSRNPGDAEQAEYWNLYYLYGVERVGRLTARRFIGDHDWYREGAEFLVAEQDSLGHYWKGRSQTAERNPHVGTSLALLFLAKGRWPVLVGKLEHGPGNSWNNHRHDAANLTHYAEEAWGLSLTWQTIDPKNASVEDLLQAPVLYISGSDLPQLDAQATKLRDYIDRGGFIFAESCCSDSAAFNKGFRDLMAKVFPEPEYKLRQLRPAHPIWRMEQITRPESPYAGTLWGVEYGCRTCVVFCEKDLSCYWELDTPGRRAQYPKSVQQQIDDANTIGINVLTYATNREPKGKEQSFVDNFAADDANRVRGRGTIELAKLSHGGGCDDAPGALANLVRTASQGEIKLRITARDEVIKVASDELMDQHMVFMHGRHDFRFTPRERDNLRTFILRGGTLLADSICASDAFGKALRRELSLTFADKQLEKIPANDPLWTSKFGGYDVQQVSVRDPQPRSGEQAVATRVRKIPPQMEGIRIGDRWGVVFSPLDMSCALENHEAVECRGYTRQDAARLGLNVILYSLNQ